jgi:DNA-binding NarL/FixJ family response regulator
MMGNKSTVIIAGSCFLITEGVKSLLEGDSRFSVANVAGSIDELLESGAPLPDLFITDISSKGFEPVILRKIKKAFPDTSFLIIADSVSHNLLKTISEAGILNILLQNSEPQEILTAVFAALKGKKYYSSDILDMIMEPLDLKITAGREVQLTNTEREIVRQIASGLTTKDIATDRNISIHTVSTHRKNIFRKLDVSNASELIMKSIRAGWIDNIEYYI